MAKKEPNIFIKILQDLDIIQKDEFLNNLSFFTPKCLAYEMDSESSIDIDTLQDLTEFTKNMI